MFGSVRVVVVANPRSTSTSSALRHGVVDALAARISVEMVETAARGHAVELARRAVASGADAVVAMGGDGTVNEVANGLLGDGDRPGIALLGVVSAGSTNVFARALGLPLDPMAAVAVLIERLIAGTSRAITVGRVDGRWFLFSAGLGFDAAVTAQVERARSRGRPASHALYVRTALRQYARVLTESAPITMSRADGSRVAGLHFVIVSNTNPWTYLGSHPVTLNPLTTLDNGLGVYGRTRIGPASMVRGLGEILATRPIPSGRGVVVEHDVSALSLDAERALPFELDGDYLGRRRRLHLEAVPRALSVLC